MKKINQTTKQNNKQNNKQNKLERLNSSQEKKVALANLELREQRYSKYNDGFLIY